VLGIEKMWHEDRTAAPRALEQSLAADERPTQRATHAVQTSSVFMGLNAVWAQEMMSRGATAEHFAAAAAKAYRHGSMNALAQYRTAMSVEEILAGRTIAGPLTRYMCSSFTDGAAAVVLSDVPVADAPKVLASAMRSGDGTLEYHERLLEAAELAWKVAGVGPEDMDVVELHDATSAEELYSLEALRFFPEGDAGPAVARGATAVGAAGVVSNPSGGLVARGHAIGATGLCQVVEIVDQLRGRAGARQVDGARVGMAINTGGILGRDTASVGCHILAS
jgi:acetyl-CoA acetyltransferase